MNRQHRFGLLLSPAEKHMLELLAEAEGLSQAATLRRLIRKAARERGLWPPKQEVQS